MASAMRKMAVYLGLVEDDHRYEDKYDSYGEYEDYDDQADPAEPADEADPRGGVKRDAEVAGGYAGYQAADWRTEHVSQTTDLARITTLHPRTYNEARTIGEHFREGTPVIMNRDRCKRILVDFVVARPRRRRALNVSSFRRPGGC